MHEVEDQGPTVERARSGDPAAVEQLLAANLPSLRAFVRLHLPAALRARESCSDLVSSVCREVLTDKNDFEYRGPEAFRGWLHAWVRNKIQDRVRYWHADKRAIGREIDVGEDESLGQVAAAYGCFGSPSGEAMRKEDLLRLEAALERLSDEHREVLALCQIAGLSREEAGRQMGGRAPGAIRSLLNRARVALSSELQRVPPPQA